jgi:serine/threonine protein kinase
MKNCPVCDTGYPDQHRTCPTDGAVLIESHELTPGSLVRGKYRVTRKLGQGGMGTVYLAEHLLLGGRVALKFLASELSRNPQFIKRFRNEARAAFQLRHPNIVEVTDLDQAEDGSLFIAMEYVDGPSLRAAIEEAPGGLAVNRALAIARGVVSGLAAAHARGTVHRDIKPENILLVGAAGQEEQPKVLDFGIAAMLEGATAVSQTRGLMLTPEYASPEQWRGTPAAELDGRTDLYALGGVLYQMLTGHPPFHAHNIEGWMFQHLQETPQPPSFLRAELADWTGLDDLVMRLLAKNRDDRLQDAELLGLLDSLLYAPSQEHPEPPREPRRERSVMICERPASIRNVENWTPPVAIQTPLPQPPTPQFTKTSTAHFPQSSTRLENPRPKEKLAVHKISEWMWGAMGGLTLIIVGSVMNFYAPQFLPQVGRSLSGQSAAETAQKQPASVERIDTRPVQPATTRDKKYVVAADSNAETEKLATPSANVPAEPEKVTSSEHQTPHVKPVHEPSAGELSQQAIALYGQKHYAEAGALFDKACAGGGWEACKNLGNMYRFGNGVALDYPRAASFYTKACNAGNARSCANLGFLYANGSGVAKDDGHAAQLYATACNNGDGMGCSNLGNVYANGRGVSKDDSQASSLYLKACAAGDGPGCSNLGSSYRFGRGVDLDLNKARQFLDKGCKMGNQWGCDRLKEMR